MIIVNWRTCIRQTFGGRTALEQSVGVHARCKDKRRCHRLAACKRSYPPRSRTVAYRLMPLRVIGKHTVFANCSIQCRPIQLISILISNSSTVRRGLLNFVTNCYRLTVLVTCSSNLTTGPALGMFEGRRF